MASASSSRGLARAVEVLRPVNWISLYTSHVQAVTTLPQMFQHYDHLSDTNVFVSYPHQREDLLGMTPQAWIMVDAISRILPGSRRTPTHGGSRLRPL